MFISSICLAFVFFGILEISTGSVMNYKKRLTRRNAQYTTSQQTPGTLNIGTIDPFSSYTGENPFFMPKIKRQQQPQIASENQGDSSGYSSENQVYSIINPDGNSGNSGEYSDGNQGNSGGYSDGNSGQYSDGNSGQYSDGNSGQYSDENQGNSGDYSDGNSGQYSDGNSGQYSDGNSGQYSDGNSGQYSDENQGNSGDYSDGNSGQYSEGNQGNSGEYSDVKKRNSEEYPDSYKGNSTEEMGTGYLVPEEYYDEAKKDYSEELKDFDPKTDKIICEDSIKTDEGDVFQKIASFFSKIFYSKCNKISILNNLKIVEVIETVDNDDDTPRYQVKFFQKKEDYE